MIYINKFQKTSIVLIIYITISIISLVDSKGPNTHIDQEQPYKSFVGRILSDEGKSQKKINGISWGKNKPSDFKSKSLKSKSYGVKDVGRSMKEDKPNWYFKDPMKHLGKSILKYEPSDASEPSPSKKIRSSSTDPKKGSGGSPSAGSPSAPSGSGPSPASGGGGTSLRVKEFSPGLAVDPDAPGWFALKETSRFGKKLMLGSLLRKRGKHKKGKNGTDDGGEDGSEPIPDPEDGENDDRSEDLSKGNRKYDKACLYLEYKDAKAAVVSTKISEEVRQKIRVQNQALTDFFLDIILNKNIEYFDTKLSVKDPLVTQKPDREFVLLELTKDIFTKYICKDKEFDETNTDPQPEKDKLLPTSFVEGIYHLFLKLYSITKNTGNSDNNEYLENKQEEWIRDYLTKCSKIDDKPNKILWYTDECKESVIAFDQENNYACTPYIEYDFNIKKYDPILDFMWHMIASVHSYCFANFQPSIRMWHRYSLAMANLFPPEMKIRWSASSEENRKLYTRLFGPNYETYFENANRCMYAANLKSDVPYLMSRFEGDRRTKFAPFSTQEFTYTNW